MKPNNTSQLLSYHRQAAAPHSADRLYGVVARIGGKNGWYFADWLWRLRGFLDTCTGGVGMRRNGTDHRCLRVGEALDFWRIEDVQPGRRLYLRAEMKVPGDAWLEFDIAPGHHQGSVFTQTAYFCPRGLAGRVYWYALLPIHAFVFRGMVRAVIKRAAVGH